MLIRNASVLARLTAVVALCLCTGAIAQSKTGGGACRALNCPCTDEQLKQGMESTRTGCQCSTEMQRKLGERWMKLYDAGKEQFDASANFNQQAIDRWREYQKEQLDELKNKLKDLVAPDPADVAKEKIKETVEEVIKRLSKKAAQYLETASNAATAAEIIRELVEITDKVRRIAKETDRMNGQAKRAADRGVDLLDKANEAIKAELATAKVCDELSRRARQGIQLTDQAHELMRKWEDENGRILDPRTHELMDDNRAFDQAVKQIEAEQQRGKTRSDVPLWLAAAAFAQAAAAASGPAPDYREALRLLKRGSALLEKRMDNVRARIGYHRALRMSLSRTSREIGMLTRPSQVLQEIKPKGGKR